MLRFGTAGLRGPLQDGPDGMNVGTVARASAGIADWLRERCLGGGLVIVGRDARHGSADFATVTAEVFAAAGFSVLPLPRPLPTPVVAFAVRELGAVAGIQITASHNPATDNGYKVYLDGGSQLIPPADAEIEARIEAVGDPILRADPLPTAPPPERLSLPAGAAVADMGEEIVRRYLARVAGLPARLGGSGTSHSAARSSTPKAPLADDGVRSPGTPRTELDDARGAGHPAAHDSDSPKHRALPVTDVGGTAPADSGLLVPRSGIRIALTAMHGVGGELAVAALRAAGFDDVHVVAEQFEPDPDFPTVSFPNPEEPGASDLLLELAERVGADVAIALDPDADRCAAGVPGAHGWRMLRGDETGVLLGDFVLRSAAPDSLVATTIVSSRLLGALAPARGARYAETLTGFKWLARAGDGLVYAYEEAIGHCVDPAAVRDKDGISAAVAVAELVARSKAAERTLDDLLDDLAVEFGVHAGTQVSLRLADAAEAAAVVERLRADPPAEIAGEKVICTDMSQLRGRMRTDALVFEGPALRLVVRPSGTEPKLKCYLEAVVPVASPGALASAKATAAHILSGSRSFCEKL
ncbi:phospho-sugar mutase [Nocardia sp. NPDC055321]